MGNNRWSGGRYGNNEIADLDVGCPGTVRLTWIDTERTHDDMFRDPLQTCISYVNCFLYVHQQAQHFDYICLVTTGSHM